MQKGPEFFEGVILYWRNSLLLHTPQRLSIVLSKLNVGNHLRYLERRNSITFRYRESRDRIQFQIIIEDKVILKLQDSVEGLLKVIK